MIRCRAAVRRSQARKRAAGFTLVELMAVVALVAILAVLATIGVGKYIRSSKTAEATQMIGAIETAQEQYRAETFAYKDISGVGALSDFSTFFPSTTPLKSKVSAWNGGTGAVADGWRELGVSAAAPVRYIYGCAAGPGTVAPAAPGITIGGYPSAATGQPWYLIKAVGDLNGNGVNSTFVGISTTAEIFRDKEDE